MAYYAVEQAVKLADKQLSTLKKVLNVRQTTELEREVSTLVYKLARLRTASNGVVDETRAMLAHNAIGEMKQQIFRIEKLLDAVLYK